MIGGVLFDTERDEVIAGDVIDGGIDHYLRKTGTGAFWMHKTISQVWIDGTWQTLSITEEVVGAAIRRCRRLVCATWKQSDR
jgi:hypothetical protein